MIFTISDSGEMEEADWKKKSAFNNAREFIKGPIELLNIQSEHFNRVVKRFFDKEILGNVQMAVHEEGKLMAFKKNKPASKFYHDTLLKRIKTPMPEKELLIHSEIKGPVVIFTGNSCLQ